MIAMRPFLIALQFLTLLPIDFKHPPEASENGYSLLYYPLIGLLMGGLLWSMLWYCNELSSSVSAALTLSLWVLMSGGLHLDGLADSADGWMGGYGNRQRTLEIMHDPYCGPMGVIVLVLVLLLKYTALEGLVDQQQTHLVIFAPLLGRSALLALFLTTPYVRKRGIGEQMAHHLPKTRGRWILLAFLLPILLFLGQPGFLLLLGAAVTVIGVRWLMLRRLQGTTGDTAGALLEITESVAVLIATAL